MMKILLKGETDLAKAGYDIVRIFYPDAEIVFEDIADWNITINVAAFREGEFLSAKAVLFTNAETILEESAGTDEIPVQGDERNNQKRLVKLTIFRLLSKFTDTPPGPWGILTGIRPTKIVHRLMDLGWCEGRITEYLIKEYDMSRDKALLLNQIAHRQRKFLLTPIEAANTVSIYIGIPFCPTRCAYCSFPAFSVDTAKTLLGPFVNTLIREIECVAKILNETEKRVQTIYIGGGTPTVLEEHDLDRLLDVISRCLISNETYEVTLEAGRPDTISKEKLKIAREHGVTRISINPQSMNKETLDIIGRCHTPEDVITAFDITRQAGFDNINMDIILGLPGENIRHVENTLREISRLNPENLTVHTLAVKRASNLKEARNSYELPGADMVSTMLHTAAVAAEEIGMVPYYLYRQKKMVGPYENIGYARPGFECLYNIQIIEERQTIIGLGGGSGSKFVDPGTWYLTSNYNPKNPETYIDRIEEIIERKIKLLRNI